ncbi:MAG: NADH-quinone oxidoreductase subunit NuoE [Planctomycetes bacterium]|nr:NADH-quinone oxidoreductase subunit NuoE [Planctomycetota bacterium]
MNLEMLDEIMRTYGYEESGVVAMLQDIQRKERYVPEAELRLVAERVGIPASRVYGLATFYRSFSLKPRGEHIINVCLGTACHVRGGARVMDKFTRDIGIQPGETTPDGKVTIEPVRCVGCCGLAPVVVVDEEVHGKMNQKKVSRIVEECRGVHREGVQA